MKKINVNIFVFVAVMLIILCGFTLKSLNTIKDAAVGLVKDIIAFDSNWMVHLSSKIDTATNKQLRYHDALVDINSAKLNVMNFDLIEKEKIVVIKTGDGYLYEEYWYYQDHEIETAVKKLDELRQVSESNGAQFLYVSSPTKGIGVEYPENATNYETGNFRRYAEAMEAAQIPYLNLVARMEQEGLLKKESYFVTDHHWKPELGFWASGEICRELNDLYGFEYNASYTDIQNYDVKVYEDWFLGSYGKQTGCYYSGNGLDDIALITPKFETNLTEEQPFKNSIRSGNFSESALHMENLEVKDPHVLNPYVVYGGGDFRLQILRNNLNPEGKKFLIIRDSTASVVTPFLSLNAGELHIMDVRDGDSYVGEKLNVYDYIEEIDPDYVMILYGGAISEVWGRLNFS